LIIDETVTMIEELYGELLKEITIERLVIGVFFTGVKLSSGCGGISYTPTSEIHGPRGSASIFRDRKYFNFRGARVGEILRIATDTPILRTVKVTVLNALSESFLAGGRYCTIGGGDALDMVDLEAARRVVMVGAIRPFLKRLKNRPGIDICVIERKTESLAGDEKKLHVSPEHAREVIPECDTVIITGASIANGTIDELLSYTKPEATVIVAGPTASFLPDALFRRNVDVVSGVWVSRPDKAIDMLGEGLSAIDLFGDCMGKISVLNTAKGRRS
jgi:uncharacterized protein